MYTKMNKHKNIFRKFKRHIVFIKRHKLLIIVIAVSFVILTTHFAPDLYFLKPVQDVSCHYSVTGDALIPIDDHFAPAANAIFFHETSCRGSLSTRQICSVESAARAHPNREIYVLFSAPINKISLENDLMNLLNNFSNIKFRRVHIVEYAKGTPVAALVQNGALNRSRWPVSHTSDVLRFLTLFKWGGVYLDLDTVVARPLDELPNNWAAREDNLNVGSSVLGIYRDEVGSMVVNAALSDLSKNFRGDEWGQNGPCLVTRVLKQICSTDDASIMSADRCKGFEVFGPELFYPVGPDYPEDFLRTPGEVPRKDAYIYHLWNRQTVHVKVNGESPYAKLAKQHCPLVFETFMEYFGSKR